MSVVVKLVKEVDGKVVKSVVLSGSDLKLLLSGIFYAKSKDYYKPRVKNYDLIYKKIYRIVNTVIR